MTIAMHSRTLLLASLLFCLAAAHGSAEEAADLTVAFSSNVNGELEPCG
jgi:hypothetical protein